jgi:lysophospholipase L1-like esterase
MRAPLARRTAPKWFALGCVAVLALWSAANASDGPSPYPKRAQDWPGVGVIRVFGWMNDNRRAFWLDRERARNSIVFAGDSLTGSWRSLAQDFSGERVANRGIGGDVSRGLLFRFEEDVLALDPKAIVILIGTNDLTARQRADQTLANIRDMLDLVRQKKRNIPVLLCTVPPSANPKAPVAEQERIALNDGLKAIAQSDPQVTLVDLFAATATQDGAPIPQYFRSDLLHLSPAGHARWKELVHSALREIGSLSRS